MSTLDKIKESAAAGSAAYARGENPTDHQKWCMAEIAKFYGGKAGNAGKRKVIKTGK